MLALSRRLAAFGLLAAQLFAGGAVNLAHALEPVDAPIRVESAQHEQCPILHDAAVCVLCSFSHSGAAGPSPSGVPIALPAVNHTASPAVTEPRALPAPRTGDARAPPHSQA